MHSIPPVIIFWALQPHGALALSVKCCLPVSQEWSNTWIGQKHSILLQLFPVVFILNPDFIAWVDPEKFTGYLLSTPFCDLKKNQKTKNKN